MHHLGDTRVLAIDGGIAGAKRRSLLRAACSA
jgi:hypothetical protein